MMRAIPAAMAALLALSAAPALAADEEEPAADETTAAEVALQRVEATESGLALSFPEDWRVSQPEGTRESPI